VIDDIHGLTTLNCQQWWEDYSLQLIRMQLLWKWTGRDSFERDALICGRQAIKSGPLKVVLL